MANDLSALADAAARLTRLLVFADLFVEGTPQYGDCPEALRTELHAMAKHIDLKKPEPGAALLKPVAEKHKAMWETMENAPQTVEFNPSGVIDSAEGVEFERILREYAQRPAHERNNETIRTQAKESLKDCFRRAGTFESEFNRGEFYKDLQQTGKEVMVEAGAFMVAALIAIGESVESGFDQRSLSSLIQRRMEAEHIRVRGAMVVELDHLVPIEKVDTEDLLETYADAFLRLDIG